MARQQGNSRRGPDDLDQAQRNLGGAEPSNDDELSVNDSSGSSGSSELSADSSGSPPQTDDGAYAGSASDDGDTEQVLAEGEMVGPWSEDEDAEAGLLAGEETVGSWSASDDEGSEEMDDRSMRAHGADRADGQHGLTGTGKEPGSGPRHR